MNSVRKMGILTFVSLLAVLTQMLLYRKTFINFWIPFSIFFVGGFLLFLLFRKKLDYYRKAKHGFLPQAFQGTVMFGGIAVFTFMGLNYFIPLDDSYKVEMRISETGFLTNAKVGRCEPPYALVLYNGMEKQLVFPCNTNLVQGQIIQVSMSKGLLGFLTVGKMTVLVSPEKLDNLKMGKGGNQYQKILDAAEANLKKGDTLKAIDYFQRAIRLMPSDKATKRRLQEISEI